MSFPAHSATVRFLQNEEPFLEWQEQNVEVLLANFMNADGFALGYHFYLDVFREGGDHLDVCIWVEDQTTPAFVLRMPITEFYEAAESAVFELVSWDNHEII